MVPSPVPPRTGDTYKEDMSPPSDSPSLTTTIDPLARGLLVGTVVAGK